MVVRKVSLMILLLSIFTLSNAQEIMLKPEIEKKINLKTEKVKVGEVVEYQTFPAVVSEDPTLSFAVSSPVEGIAEKVYVKLGDHVKKGQILLAVYSPTIASLQANIEMAKVKLQTAKQVLEREENLYKEEVIPFARYQAAKIEYERSLGEYQALKKALSSYGEVKGNSIILRSKVNGFVADIKVINGNPVNVGEELMRVHSHDRLWVIAQVPFEITKDLKIGQKVIVISPSLAGLAIGIGLFADATVVVVENIYRHLHETGLSQTGESKNSIVSKSVKEVFKPVLFAILIITIVFLPIFSFESVEGKYYKPLALTIIFALISSLLVAFVFMPVMAYFILKPSKEEETKIMRYINDLYHRILYKLLRYPKAVISIVLTAFIFSLFLLSRIGTEFAPTLDEGAVLVKSFLNPNVSLQESKRVASFVEETAKSFPEVEDAFSNIGRAEKGEPEDVSYIETFITLKPYDQWKNFKTRQEFENALREKLKDFPGVSFSFTQPIQMRIDELLSGVKSTVAIKVFGDDLNKVNEIAFKIEDIVRNTKGSVDVETESQSGKLQLKITPKIDQLNRYNLKTEDILALVGKYFTGYEANQVKKELITFPVIVRLPEDYINDIEKIKNIPIQTKDGYLLTLSQVADLEITPGFFKIRHENGIRYGLVQSNLEGRDLGGFVQELKNKLNTHIKLPEGYFIQFSGQFENQERAMKRLSIIVPIAIFLIFVLLYVNYNSVKDALIVMLNVPFATIGGIVSLYISGYNLSVPAAIGFIAVFGIATLNGVVLISYIRQLLQEGLDIDKAIEKATRLRLRPILITATAASLGLIPILLTSDIGSETQKPIATVVIGGIFTSTMLTLLILPIVYKTFYRVGLKNA